MMTTSRCSAVLQHAAQLKPTTLRLLVILAFGVFGALPNLLAVGSYAGVGAFYGVVIGLGIMLFELGYLLSSLRRCVRRLKWLLALLASEVIYLGLIATGGAFAGIVTWTLGLLDETLVEAVTLRPTMSLYALAITAVLNAVARTGDLIGQRNFLNLLLGRYHRPFEEERIFLFLDIIGSTAKAQRHGDLQAERF